MQKIERVGIIFAIVTSVISAAFAITSFFVSLEANRLARLQYELERYGAEPVFTIELEEGGDFYVVIKSGAEIYDVRCTINPRIQKNYSYHSYNEDGYGDDFRFKYIVELFGLPSDLDSPFDEKSQTIRLSTAREYSYADDVGFRNFLDQGIDGTSEIVKVAYRNYLNQECSIELAVIWYDEMDGTMHVSYNTSQPEDVAFTVTMKDFFDYPVDRIQDAITAYLAKNNIYLDDND